MFQHDLKRPMNTQDRRVQANHTMNADNKVSDETPARQHPSFSCGATECESCSVLEQNTDHFDYMPKFLDEATEYFRQIDRVSTFATPPSKYLTLFRISNASNFHPHTFDEFAGPLIREIQGKHYLNGTFTLRNQRGIPYDGDFMSEQADIRRFLGEDRRGGSQRVQDMLRLSEVVGQVTPRCVGDILSRSGPIPILAPSSGYWIAGKFFITCAHAIANQTWISKYDHEWRTVTGFHRIEGTVNNAVSLDSPRSYDAKSEVKLIEILPSDDIAIYMLLPGSAGPRRTLPLDMLGGISMSPDTKIFAMGYPMQDWFLSEEEQQRFAQRSPRVRDYIKALITVRGLVTQSQAMLCDTTEICSEASKQAFFDEELAWGYAYEDIFHQKTKSLAIGSALGPTAYPPSNVPHPYRTFLIKTDMSLFFGFAGGMVGYLSENADGAEIIICGLVHGVDPRDATKNACTIFSRKGLRWLQETLLQLSNTT